MSEVTDVLWGCVDMHVHSGPSTFRRRFNHVEAARDAGERLGMRAILCKDHHHNTVMDLLALEDQLEPLPTKAFGGIAMNNQIGLNPYAVEMCLGMGGKAVWLPTVSAAQHIGANPEKSGFPSAVAPLRNVEVSLRDDDDALRAELLDVLDLVAQHDALLSGGHMDPDTIEAVFTEAKRRGVTRMVVSHPNLIIDLRPEQARRLVALGAYIEHEVGMYGPQGTKQWGIEVLTDWIDAVGVEHTVLASDLGQVERALPVDAFCHVGELLLGAGVPEADVRRMACENPSLLLGLDA